MSSSVKILGSGAPVISLQIAALRISTVALLESSSIAPNAAPFTIEDGDSEMSKASVGFTPAEAMPGANNLKSNFVGSVLACPVVKRITRSGCTCEVTF